MARKDYGMCAGKKVALLLSSSLPLLLLFLVAPNAKTCLLLDYENSAAATVWGRVTTFHKVPKGSELRSARGPFLTLDQPLLANVSGPGDDCHVWRQIAILGEDTEITKWVDQRVKIEGKLDRFGSALISPAIFIWVTNIKKD